MSDTASGFISGPRLCPRLWFWLSSFWKVRDLTENEILIMQELLAGRWRV